MSAPVHLLVVSLIFLMVCTKKGAKTEAPQIIDQLTAIAAFEILEELEGEDSFLGSELPAHSVGDEIEWRAQSLNAQVDKNGNQGVDPEEMKSLRTLIKDKMLEKFDVDSDGLFNGYESDLIREKISQRLSEFRGRHPENFEQKKEFICKIVRERNETFAEKLTERPLFAKIAEECRRF